MFSERIKSQICTSVSADSITNIDTFKTVWSGFGALHRVYFSCKTKPIVVKSICLPSEINHPRGWNSRLATARKLKSYRVEQHFYAYVSHHLNTNTAKFIGLFEEANTQYLVLSDLSINEFKSIAEHDLEAVKRILDWLAHFHVENLGNCDENLWQQGSYWHLATRPDEFNAISHQGLKLSAQSLDAALRLCPYQTIIHGDAKIANFMENEEAVVGYDFQYTGKGVGIIDVILLLSSAFNSDELFAYETELLADYKTSFLKYCQEYKIDNGDKVMTCWLHLYATAWADFARLLDGWSPGHWKLHDYTWSQVD